MSINVVIVYLCATNNYITSTTTIYYYYSPWQTEDSGGSLQHEQYGGGGGMEAGMSMHSLALDSSLGEVSYTYDILYIRYIDDTHIISILYLYIYSYCAVVSSLLYALC